VSVIPRVFHFVFGLADAPVPFSLVHYLCLASCIEINTPERVCFHYAHEPTGPYWDLIKPKLTLHWIYPVWKVARWFYRDPRDAAQRHIRHTELIRLQVLREHGGIYADIDTLFVNPLPPALYQKPFVLGRLSEGSLLGTAWIASQPGADFGAAWLDGLQKQFDGRSHDEIPTVLEREHPAWVHVEPRRSFYKYGPTRDDVQALLEEPTSGRGSDLDVGGVHSIHLWQARWAEWWRRDLTRVHDGLLTEPFIRSVDTTFTLLARRFLPESSTSRPPRRPWGQATAARTGTPPLRPAKPVIPALDRVLTRCGIWWQTYRAWLAQHDRRRSLRERSERFRRFWIGSVFERDNIVGVVAFDDEYELGNETFQPRDVIVDVGAHIGAFSYWCYLKGSRAIHCYEPSERNFQILERNLAGKAVERRRVAVWRSDKQDAGELRLSGPATENTAEATVMAAGTGIDFARQQMFEGCDRAEAVPCVALDDILDRFERVALLKIDCEGSEFPILLTSRCLHKVERIVGEIHEMDELMLQRGDPRGRVSGYCSYRREHLTTRLESEGFRVRVRPGHDHMWVFEARRS
jgi:FkbM family methyltransferase